MKAIIKKAFTKFPAAIVTYIALAGMAWLIASKWF